MGLRPSQAISWQMFVHMVTSQVGLYRKPTWRRRAQAWAAGGTLDHLQLLSPRKEVKL